MSIDSLWTGSSRELPAERTAQSLFDYLEGRDTLDELAQCVILGKRTRGRQALRCGLCGSVVDEKRRGVVKEPAQQRLDILWKRGGIERAIHQRHPPIARRLVEPERQVAHAQPRVTALDDVALGTPEPIDQKVAEALLGSREVAARIQHAQNVVSGHLRVKGAHQPRESVFTDPAEDVPLRKSAIVHRTII